MKTNTLDPKLQFSNFITGMQIPNPIIVSESDFKRIYRESLPSVQEMIYNLKVAVFSEGGLFTITHDQIFECFETMDFSDDSQVSQFKYLLIRLKPQNPVTITFTVKNSNPAHSGNPIIFWANTTGEKFKKVHFTNPFKFCVKKKHHVECRSLLSNEMTAEDAFELYYRLRAAGSTILVVNIFNQPHVWFEFHPLKFTEKDIYILRDVLAQYTPILKPLK